MYSSGSQFISSSHKAMYKQQYACFHVHIKRAGKLKSWLCLCSGFGFMVLLFLEAVSWLIGPPAILNVIRNTCVFLPWLVTKSTMKKKKKTGPCPPRHQDVLITPATTKNSKDSWGKTWMELPACFLSCWQTSRIRLKQMAPESSWDPKRHV